MLRVTVKKRRRKILEISDDLCRYYPDDLDIPVSFSLCEIAQIERCDNRTETMVYLRDAVGRTLAEFELYNTDGGTEALRFFRDCNLQKLTDEKGQLLPRFEIVVTEKEPTERQKQLEAADKKERARRKAVKAEWAKNPLFYETQTWIHRIRLISRGLLFLGLLSFLLLFTTSYQTTAVLCIVWPLVIWIFYLCFHRIMVWDLHVHENYIVPPFALLALFAFVIVLKGRIYNVSAGHLWKLILFCLFLFLLLLLPLLWIWDREKHWLESWKAPVAFILAYSLVTAMAWNVLLTFEEPRYENVVILDKDSRGSGGRHRIISYFFTVETQDGKRLRATTYGGLYGQVEPGDEVILRWDNSVLGITYYQIQSGDTGEKQ